jgi:hypothetical protein
VITKVVHGWRVGGLVAYLMGPGRAEEHRRPRVVASWDGRDTQWQPQSSGPRQWDLELGSLIRALQAPAVAARLTEDGRAEGKRGYVWHCSARVASGDRVLNDGEWGEIARELLHGAGIAERDDPGGPRWVAIRHADDHIHIAVVLVRQDTGRRFWPYRDYPRLRETARELERRLGLTVTAAADGTAERAPTRGEREKAARQGRRPARAELVRAIRRAAIAAHDVASFEAALQEGGYRIEIRRGPSGDPLGYKVARPADLTATGEPIYYSGSKLAADLSLPRLLRRWAQAPCAGGEDGDQPVIAARAVVERARRVVADSSKNGGGGLEGATEEVVYAGADVVAAVGWPGWEQAAVAFDHAARPAHGQIGSSSPLSLELRRVARRLVRRRTPIGADEISAGAALAVALVALAWEIAAWRRRRAQPHQAAAADVAASVLAAWSARLPSPDAARTLHPRPGLGSDTPRARIDPSGR